MPENEYFIITLLHVTNKKALERAYKRFVSSNLDVLKELDSGKIDPFTKKQLKQSNRMFKNNKFQELKGSQFDKNMKLRFLDYFTRKQHFEIYYIKIANSKLTDTFCKNTARIFNYVIKLALQFYLRKGYLPVEDYHLQLDERNEKTESRYFLKDYLNTELILAERFDCNFEVTYFDSADNKFIQIADVFSNIYYSHPKTKQYFKEIQDLRDLGFIKDIFEFPI